MDNCNITHEDMDAFSEIMQSKLPKYIQCNVEYQPVSGYLLSKLIFPDGSKVNYAYRLTDKDSLNDRLAIHLIICMIEISIVNLEGHLKLLDSLKEQFYADI